ncbi:MAG: hypothetical protein M3Y69_05695 [Verrucomicrobiota bacterium]|nr:hypothetical protein [Verrucomicrobiota bacterium]
MHLRVAALLTLCALLGSCAYQGVVVDKSARELPFSETVGAPGSFAFMLRDSTGAVHRQLVTPEVFASYNVGDFFSDLQPAPTQHGNAPEDKVVLTASRTRLRQQSAITTVHAPKATAKLAAKARAKSGSKVASTSSTKKNRKSHRSVATKHRTHKKVDVAKTKHHTKPATPAFVTKPTDVDIVDVGAGRPAVH